MLAHICKFCERQGYIGVITTDLRFGEVTLLLLLLSSSSSSSLLLLLLLLLFNSCQLGPLVVWFMCIGLALLGVSHSIFKTFFFFCKTLKTLYLQWLSPYSEDDEDYKGELLQEIHSTFLILLCRF